MKRVWGNSSVPGVSNALRPGWPRSVALLFAILLSVHGETGFDDSPVFALDTRFTVITGSADSADFRLDTRFDYAIGLGSGDSHSFILDTRFSGSTGSGASEDFTLDTRGAVVANAVVNGQVSSLGGQALVGALVMALQSGRVMASDNTVPDGSYVLPALPAGAYELRATLAGYGSGIRLLALNDTAVRQDFALRPVRPPPEVLPGNRPVSPEQQPRLAQASSTQLKVYDGSRWATGGTVDRAKMTIVLTHGWVRCNDPNGGLVSWPTTFASALWVEHHQDHANILAWDWREQANGCPAPPVDATPPQGLALGQALYGSLGSGYSREVHFVGHSLGALVNAHAANWLHGDLPGAVAAPSPPWQPDRTHITLLDEAEVASAVGQAALFGWSADTASARGLGLPTQLASGALGYTVALVNDWRNPIPENSAWVDNYISLFGINHPNALNVGLQAAVDTGFFNWDFMHHYPVDWYYGTLVRPSWSFLGFTNSFEVRGSLPPSGQQYSYGLLYLQAGSLGEPYSLRLASDDDFTQAQQEVLSRTLGNYSADVVEGTSTVLDTIGDTLVETGEGAVRLLNQGAEWVGDASQTVWNFVSRPGIILRLRSGPSSNSGGAGLARAASEASVTNAPPGAWMQVPVPVNAVFLVFDFTLSGDGQDDSVVCGINGTNVFTLAMKFVAPDAPTSSGPIDVSAHAGRTVELFFAVLGGISTNCSVTVENIRFLMLPAPSLRLARVGSQCVVQWLGSATGFVLETTDALSTTNAIWATITNEPVVVDFLNTVTNDASGGSRFYRLRRQP